MAYSRDSSEDLRWDSSTGQYVTNSVSNPVFYVYPYGVEFTATYGGTGTTFNQNDCTVETDGNNIKHYTYSITTTEPGTLSVTSYGNNYSLIVNDSTAHYDLTITVTKPSKLYSWSRKFYAWTNSDTGSDITFWTLNENPEITEIIYNRSGDDVTSSYLYDSGSGSARIVTVSSSAITIFYTTVGFNLPVSDVANNTGGYVYNRDPLRDFLSYEDLYTSEKLPKPGMYLYNNDGTYAEQKIDNVITNNIFNSQKMYYCWMADVQHLYVGAGNGYIYLFTETPTPKIGDVAYAPVAYNQIRKEYINRIFDAATYGVDGIYTYPTNLYTGNARYSNYDTTDILGTLENIFSSTYGPYWSGDNWWTCLTGDTLVTLSDRSTKRLDEIEVGDKVLSINPETGEYVEDEVIFTDKDQVKTHTCYDLWTFSDGYSVKTVHRHRFYNVEDNSFTYMDRWNIGDHTISQDGKLLELLSHETIEEEVRHYKITTKNYHNYFANGMLTGSRLTQNFNHEILKIGEI